MLFGCFAFGVVDFEIARWLLGCSLRVRNTLRGSLVEPSIHRSRLGTTVALLLLLGSFVLPTSWKKKSIVGDVLRHPVPAWCHAEKLQVGRWMFDWGSMSFGLLKWVEKALLRCTFHFCHYRPLLMGVLRTFPTVPLNCLLCLRNPTDKKKERGNQLILILWFIFICFVPRNKERALLAERCNIRIGQPVTHWNVNEWRLLWGARRTQELPPWFWWGPVDKCGFYSYKTRLLIRYNMTSQARYNALYKLI